MDYDASEREKQRGVEGRQPGSKWNACRASLSVDGWEQRGSSCVWYPAKNWMLLRSCHQSHVVHLAWRLYHLWGLLK